MLTGAEKTAIRNSWRLVIPIADTAAELFYKRLFELRPEYVSLFSNNMDAQKRKLIKMLAFIVKSVDYREEEWRDDVPPEQDLMLVVLALGRRHTELYHIPDESYGIVAQSLLWTLDYGLGDAFTNEVRAAWTHLYTLLAQTMRMGALSLDRDPESTSAQAAESVTEPTLLTQLADAGIDEARLGMEEPSS